MKTLLVLLTLSLILPATGQDRSSPNSGGHGDAKAYMPVLEQGLNDQVEHMIFPIGQVRIMGTQESELAAQAGKAGDWQSREFPAGFLTYLEQAQSEGLLKLEEQQGEGLAQGARFFMVRPTEKLFEMHDARASSSKYLKVRIGNCHVIEIVSDEPFTPPQGMGGPGDQFRLVLGRAKDTLTEACKQLGSFNIVAEEFRFRAILQVDPLNKTHAYVIADLGKIESNDWRSNYVQTGQVPAHLRPPQPGGRGVPKVTTTQGAQIPSAKIQEAVKQAQGLMDATMRGDFDKIVDAMPAVFVEQMGKREEVIEQAGMMMKQMEKIGMTITSFKVGHPADQLTDGTSQWLVLPTTMETEHPKGRLKVVNYLLALSRDNGETWKFVSINDQNREMVPQMLPSFPASLILPKSPRPEAIAR